MKKPSKPRRPSEPKVPSFEILKKVFLGQPDNHYNIEYHFGNNYPENDDDDYYYDEYNEDEIDPDYEEMPNESIPFLVKKVFVNLDENLLAEDEDMDSIKFIVSFENINKIAFSCVEKLASLDFKLNSNDIVSRCKFGMSYNYSYYDDGEYFISVPIVNPNFEAETFKYNQDFAEFKIKYDKYEDSMKEYNIKLQEFESQESAKKKALLEKKQAKLKKEMEALNKNLKSL